MWVRVHFIHVFAPPLQKLIRFVYAPLWGEADVRNVWAEVAQLHACRTCNMCTSLVNCCHASSRILDSLLPWWQRAVADRDKLPFWTLCMHELFIFIMKTVSVVAWSF